jgi:hypothetical protein
MRDLPMNFEQFHSQCDNDDNDDDDNIIIIIMPGYKYEPQSALENSNVPTTVP